MDNLETVLQIISIIVFITGGLTFFFKTGSYKTNVDTKLQSLDEDVKENKKEIEDLRDDFEKTKTEHNIVTSRLETLLIEVKTKLELLMQFSNWKKDERD